MNPNQDEELFGQQTDTKQKTSQTESAFVPASPRDIPVRQTQPHDEPAPPADAAELLRALQRIEQVLGNIRGQMELSTREQQHREFSPARLIGALLQALVVGFAIAALADWVFQASAGTQLVKLAFAGVLQLGALTAFALARGDR